MVAEPKLIGIAFLVTGALLVFTAFFKERKNYGKMNLLDSIVIGAAQGVGVLPGISRSGATIGAALGMGLDRAAAAEYSFLLSIPAILGAFLFDLKDASSLGVEISVPALIAGMVTAFLTGLLAIYFLLKLIKSGKFYLFSFYLVPLGVAVLLFA